MKRFFLVILAALLFCTFGTVAGDTNDLIARGSTGEDVVRIQMRLFDLGFYTYKPTGSFQTVTKSAVVAYQVASGIMSDGSVGAESMQLLFSRGAKRADFHAEIPLTFTAQGAITQKGSAMPWATVKEKLIPGEAYRFRNAATGEEVALIFGSGENHAELTLPEKLADRNAAVSMLTRWLGSTNSFYKCAVLLELDGQWIAASMQWNGADRVCVYCKDSRSHVRSFPDAEHEANIRKVSY